MVSTDKTELLSIPTDKTTERLSTDLRDLLRQSLEPKRLSLVVFHHDGVETTALSPGLPVVVGRDASCDLPVPDRSLTRRHATFAFDSGKITVEDHGSTNGTWLLGQRVRGPAEMKTGDQVILGRYVVARVYGHEPSEQNLGFESEESFRQRLDDEVVRARFFKDEFAVLMLRSQKVGGWSPALRTLLRPVDRIALYSPYGVQILLPDIRRDDALELARTLIAPDAGCTGPVFVGLAVYPDSSTTADSLIELSRTAAGAATAAEPVQLAPMKTWRVDLVPRSGSPGTPAGSPTSAPELATGGTMRRIFELAARFAPARLPVIIRGETGAGKELVARYLHDQGPRKSRPMVCVNCGAISPHLVESTLFGHEKGAFTSAVAQQRGVFEEASGGTVFLDEIGELPMPAQAALLRVLETQRLTRVGSTKEIAIDVRIIAATHRDLDAMCAAGSFRKDLFFRMNGALLEIPPLRDRPEEIEALARRFLEEAGASSGDRVRGITREALALLVKYRWPGNVRELKNAMERAVVIAHDEMICEHDLPERVTKVAAVAQSGEDSDPGELLEDGLEEGPAGAGNLRDKLERYERQLIEEALDATRWNKTEAARLLELPLRTLVHKVKALGLKRAER